MKLSISIKLVLGYFIILIIIFLVSIFLNKKFFGKFYISRTISRLENNAKEIKDDFDKNNIIDKEKYKNDYNIRIDILDLRKPFNRKKGRGMANLMRFMRKIKPHEFEKIEKGEMLIRVDKPHFSTNKFLVLALKLKDRKILVLSTSIFQMTEAENIAFDFFLFTSFIAVIVGIVLIVIYSKNITKPILKLKNISYKIAKLDFSEKSLIKTGDELEELGSSINHLSFELEQSITKLNQSNEKLKQDIEKVKKIDTMRKEFISNISHELKTPIAVIGGYAEGLKDNVNEDKEGREFYIDVIMEESKKMSKMVNKLLELAKLENENERIDKRKEDIIGIVKKLLKKYKIIIEEKNIKLLIVCDSDELIYEINKNIFETIIDNLFTNAVTYCKENGIIEIKINRLNDKIKIVVKNNGEKIPEDKLKEIWEPFVILDKSRNKKFGGTGLGLSLVKEGVEKLSGEYGVENKDDFVEFFILI